MPDTDANPLCLVRGPGLVRALLGLAAMGAFLVALVWPSAASADEPFRIEFDQSEIKVGLLPDLPLDTIRSGSTLEGTIDENGKVTIPQGKFTLPELGLDEPVRIRAFMGIESQSTGTFDPATGRLELDARAGIWLSVDVAALLDVLGLDVNDLVGQLGGGSFGGINLGSMLTPLLSNLTCGFSPMDVHFTTESNSLASGKRFIEGPAGTGAITAEWSQLGPFAGRTKILGLIDPCQLIMDYLPGLIESGVGGSLPDGIDLGGLDLAGLLANLDNLNPGPSAITLTRSQADLPVKEPTGPTAKRAKLRLKVTPRLRRVRAGRPATFRVRVRNVGGRTARKVRVCLTGPGVGILRRWRCVNLGPLKAGKVKTRRVRVRVNRRAPLRQARFRFRVKSVNAVNASTRARLRIRR